MSMTVILAATHKVLKQHGVFTDQVNSTIRLTPEPPPYSGFERFVCIHPLNWDPGITMSEQHEGSDELFSIGITLTRRCSVIPNDQHAQRAVFETVTGLETLARRVLKVMHEHRYDIQTYCNVFIRDPIHQMAFPSEYDPNIVGSAYEYSNHNDTPWHTQLGSDSPYIILAVDASQFIEPLLFQGTTGFQYTPPGWFHSTERQPDKAEDGVYITLRFGGCRRMQSITADGGIY
jgi:hypothetical protein